MKKLLFVLLAAVVLLASCSSTVTESYRMIEVPEVSYGIQASEIDPESIVSFEGTWTWKDKNSGQEAKLTVTKSY